MLDAIEAVVVLSPPTMMLVWVGLTRRAEVVALRVGDDAVVVVVVVAAVVLGAKIVMPKTVAGTVVVEPLADAWAGDCGRGPGLSSDAALRPIPA